MRMLRKRGHCHVPGHGVRCEVARERGAARYARTTEKRIALRYERVAGGLRSSA